MSPEAPVSSPIPLLTQMIVMPGGQKTPMMMEVPVSSELDGPFLFLSSKSYFWAEHSFKHGFLRTAVRKILKPLLFRELVEIIATSSLERQWGNVHPSTREGVVAGFSHLADYDILDVEVLYGSGFDLSILPDDVNAVEASWAPDGWALVLPTDRSFLGTTFNFGGNQHGSLIHNASRGIAIIQPVG